MADQVDHQRTTCHARANMHNIEAYYGQTGRNASLLLKRTGTAAWPGITPMATPSTTTSYSSQVFQATVCQEQGHPYGLDHADNRGSMAAGYFFCGRHIRSRTTTTRSPGPTPLMVTRAVRARTRMLPIRVATVALAALASAITVGGTLVLPTQAVAKPELLSAAFQQPPQAGQEATLELHVRDPDASVDDIHLFWGDGGVNWVVPAQPGVISSPNPLTPKGGEQVILLKYTYRRAGAFLINMELYGRGVRTDAQIPADVGPCAAPRLNVRLKRTGRDVVASVTARDGDAFIDEVTLAWGDGVVTTVAAIAMGNADLGAEFAVRRQHRFSRRFARRHTGATVKIRATSIDNPSSCGTPSSARVQRRIAFDRTPPVRAKR